MCSEHTLHSTNKLDNFTLTHGRQLIQIPCCNPRVVVITVRKRFIDCLVLREHVHVWTQWIRGIQMSEICFIRLWNMFCFFECLLCFKCRRVTLTRVECREQQHMTDDYIPVNRVHEWRTGRAMCECLCACFSELSWTDLLDHSMYAICFVQMIRQVTWL